MIEIGIFKNLNPIILETFKFQYKKKLLKTGKLTKVP